MKKLLILFTVLAFAACSTGEKKNAETKSSAPEEVVEASLSIGGMTCEHCVMSVTKGLNEVEGIAEVAVTLDDSTAIVKYDASAVNMDDLKAAVSKRGYTVKSVQ